MINTVRFAILAALSFPLLAAPPSSLEFNRDVRPILSDRCFSCHGPDPLNRKTKMRLDQAAGAQSVLAAGDPEHSELYRRITSTDKVRRMPPAYTGQDKLSDSEIAVIRRWIEAGAPYQNHWSFIPPKKAPLPEVKARDWPRHPIDSYVLARLEREGLAPSPEASRRTLIRRVTLDLTGLPPTPEEVDAFLADTSPNAYEKLVDRLLSSNRYAERMAIRWLEAARYADTHGYQADGQRTMWRWRDWVLEAFDKNMPFDQFTIEQLAGDLLPNPTLSQKIATGFQRNHRSNGEGGIVPEEFRVEYVADRTETTATVWLGLTMGCSRCHDHKYDPIRQKDFYSLFAFYNNVPEKGLVYNFGNDEPMIKAPTSAQQQKLAELDAKLASAEARWAEAEPKARKAQESWEKSVRKNPELDWKVTQGIVVDETLKETIFDGKRAVDLGDKAKFNYMDPFTIAAWVTPDSPNGTIVSKVEDYFEGQGYGVFLMDGKVRLHIILRFTDIGLRLETAEPLKLHQRSHIVVSYDGRRYAKGVRIFVNGQEQKINVLFDDLNYPFGSKAPLRIGAGFGPKFNFQGSIEQVRIFNRALRPEEIDTLPLEETVGHLAAIPAARRTPARQHKLDLCFLEDHAPAPMKHVRGEMFAARAELDKFHDTIPTVMVMEDTPEPRQAFILTRGAYDAHGDPVSPAVPSFLPPLPENAPANRLGLARWLVDRSNPLTARVTVNRFWQMLFGTGLVKTVEDFGSQGEWPMYPELLDWLAVEFMDNGWNIKALLKQIVMSSLYRQASAVDPKLLDRDPENRLFARGPRLRLSAEMIRDQALALSGLLVEKFGGPSVKPYQPPGLWQELSGGKGYETDKGEGLYRRSLYTYWKRTIAPPAMVTFDSPTRETCVVRETRTNTPLQALDLMNDVTYVEAARKLAERLLHRGAAPPERIAYLYRLALARPPKPQEALVLEQLLATLQARYAADPQAAEALLKQGESPRDATLPPAELAAYTGIASLVLNLDETVTKQ